VTAQRDALLRHLFYLRDARKKMIEAKLPGATQSDRITIRYHRLTDSRHPKHSVDRLLRYDPKDNSDRRHDARG